MSDSAFYQEHTLELIGLHDQVQTSVNLLDSLEGFLSKFQKDLSAVSGQISDLQNRSKDIDARLKSRRKIEKPLSNLLTEICIPPALATLILDTEVGEPWITGIQDFEGHLLAMEPRTKLKSVKDLSSLGEGLRIVAATKLRLFFLNLLTPIKTSMSTNLPVLQNSILLKYRPLYVFLLRHVPDVAAEIQRAYTGATRTYYETGFRRYLRTLTAVKSRSSERSESIAAPPKMEEPDVDWDRLANATLEGSAATLAYMTEDKAFKEPTEALFRSMMMTLLDNSTVEYAFVVKFFTKDPSPPPPRSPLVSPTTPRSFMRRDSGAGQESTFDADEATPRAKQMQVLHEEGVSKEDKAAAEGIWKHIFDPVLQYCDNFLKTILDSSPAVTPLLTMIRLNDAIISECSVRDCPPLESFAFGLRLVMWPVLQKDITGQVDSLKKLIDSTTAGYLTKVTIKDNHVQAIARRYAVLFASWTALTVDEEAMIFSNLGRLRQELSRLITMQANKIKDPAQNASYLVALYEIILHFFSSQSNGRISTHPKAQSEISFWREKEDQARRRIQSIRK
ncbi:Vps52-domain-containing protein [Sistotremastrum niveocremeum HHB9708]|uniref:Vps52-domain-containing protein n=1 Tax=Sistotremastrum niveocremeum HHB9708 TaxID=1314777 RepID=A0A164ZJ88_9AGAM|nr:Vps52-domain-containing protein [Sistotremastrum niveocremeum HHB9708]